MLSPRTAVCVVPAALLAWFLSSLLTVQQSRSASEASTTVSEAPGLLEPRGLEPPPMEATNPAGAPADPTRSQTAPHGKATHALAGRVGHTVGTGRGPTDCNRNDIEDECDLDCGEPGGDCDVPGCGHSSDCNGNGVPDECDPSLTPTTVRVATSRDLSRPVYLTAAPGDFDRVFIVEQPGRIRILRDGHVIVTPFLDIDALVGGGTNGGDERGLLSMAFHPDYDANGYFYVNYTNNSGHTVIARYSVSGDPDIADPNSAFIHLTIPQPFNNHNGGQLQFGPDGYLYIGMGDGGSGNDPGNRAQDITDQLLGKLLRIDVDGDPPYGIPPDNPFVGEVGDDEIWAYGMRNPWRFGFDRLTGEMYIGDVGQNAREEIDFQPADSPGGENYGWRCMEGFNCTGLSGCTCNHPSLTLPILDYALYVGGTCTVIGGYVYRGCALPALSGTYFYADYCANWIKSFRYVNGQLTDEHDWTAELAPEEGSISSISSFGQDAAGELYICCLFSDEVYKIVPVEGDAVCGNDILEPGEECDDGNQEPGDGCDENCQIEVADPIRGGQLYDRWWIVNGQPEPEGDHPLYPPIGQQSGSTTFRCKECHGWDYKGADGAYGPGSSHYTGIPGVFGSTMTPEEMFEIVKLDPDSAPNGHNYEIYGLSDVDIWDLVEFMQTLVIDTDDYIDGDANFLGDEAQGEIHFTTGGIMPCIACHGACGTVHNFGSEEDPEYVGTVAVNNPWEFHHKVRFAQPGTPMPSWLEGGGDDQGVADIGRYAQLNLCVGAADGDMDGDGDTDGADIQAFVDALITGSTEPVEICPGDFDVDCDIDMADVGAFVTALLAP